VAFPPREPVIFPGMRHVSALALVAFLLASAPAAAQKVKDDSTGISFDVRQDIGGVGYTCLGAGVRKILVFKAYAVTFCLEQSIAEKTVRGYIEKTYPNLKGEDLADALEDDPKFFEELLNARGDKLVIMRVVRNISRDQVANAFRDSLEEILPESKVQKLIETIPGDIKDGQSARLYSKGSSLTIDIAGTGKTIEDADIAKKLWWVWLGPSGATPSLKDSIARQAALRSP
jgi:hypothetical protein